MTTAFEPGLHKSQDFSFLYNSSTTPKISDSRHLQSLAQGQKHDKGIQL